MFNIGDYVVYGSTGVCKITDITTEKALGGSPLEYYVMSPIFTKSTVVKTPVNIIKVKIRPTITDDEAKNLLGSVSEIEPYWDDNYRTRNETFRQAAHSCDCGRWLWLIKSIKVKAEELAKINKKIRQTDELFLGNTEKLLCGELAVVLGKEYDEIKELLEEKISSAVTA